MRRCKFLLYFVIFFLSCNSKKHEIFYNYELSDTIINGNFAVYPRFDKFNNKQFQEFKLSFLNNKYFIYGFIGIVKDSLFIYYPDTNEEYLLAILGSKINCDSISIRTKVILDSGYMSKHRIKACNDSSFVSDGKRIFVIKLYNISIFKSGDNLNLYFSKSKGVEGWASTIENKIILTYNGNIFGDSNYTIQKKKTIIE